MKKTTESIPNHLLRRERERRAWSQQDLADAVGTTPLNVSRWERGITNPSPYFRQKLCEVFETTSRDLGLLAQVEELPPVSSGSSEASSTVSPPAPSSGSLWNVPYRRNPFFTGREDVLTLLRDTLLEGQQPVALAQPQAISGLGGIGKTQTAIEYANRYREAYQAVFWAKAESRDLLISDFLTVAALLNLPERNEQDQNTIVKGVIRWLDTHADWLLILDNADDLEVASEFFPSASTGHILLTTRSHSLGTLAQRIDLEKMSLKEGTIFLLRRVKRLKNHTSLESIPGAVRAQAQAIVEALDGLPLALDQAGAYIEETGCSLGDYLKYYKTRQRRLLRTRGRDASGHPEPVATTWSLAFEKVEQANPAAAELLRLCAFLHPDEIPERMIIEGASELPVLQSAAGDEMEWDEAIGELRRYSLVKRDPEEKILNIHRLVQAVVRDGMEEGQQKGWVERVVKMVSSLLPKVEFATWPVYQRCLPHAQVAAELAQQFHIESMDVAQLLNRTGAYLAERGQYSEAKPMLLRALSLQEQPMGPDSAYIAEILNNLGIIHWMQGNYDEAITLLLRAKDVQEKTLGSEHPSLAETLDNLGVLYNAQGKHSQAVLLQQRALAIWEHALSEDDPIIAYGYSNLASVYDDIGRYHEAEELYKRALALRQRTQGTEHPEISTILNNLAVLYSHMGRNAETIPLLEQSLVITEKTLGMEHPRRATTFHNLARNYQKQGDYEQAEYFYKESLVLRQKILGMDHPETAFSLDGLAGLYHLQGKYDRAEQLFQQTIEIREKTLGNEHSDLASTLHGMAKLYLDQQKFEQAEPLLQRALTIREASLGAEHPDVASTLESYVALLRRVHRESEAEEMEARAQAIRANT